MPHLDYIIKLAPIISTFASIFASLVALKIALLGLKEKGRVHLSREKLSLPRFNDEEVYMINFVNIGNKDICINSNSLQLSFYKFRKGLKFFEKQTLTIQPNYLLLKMFWGEKDYIDLAPGKLLQFPIQVSELEKQMKENKTLKNSYLKKFHLRSTLSLFRCKIKI